MKKNKIILLITSLLILILLITLLIPSGNYSAQSWAIMTYEQREQWINSYMDKPDDNGYRMIEVTKQTLLNKFQHPESVTFNNSPTFLKTYRNIVEADSGWVFTYGTGKSDKINFSYTVKWKITPNDLKILETNIDYNK